MTAEEFVDEMIKAFKQGVTAGRAESAGRIEELLDQSARAYADGVADGVKIQLKAKVKADWTGPIKRKPTWNPIRDAQEKSE